MKKNLFAFSATLGFSLSLLAAPQEATEPFSLACKGQTAQSLQNFIADNNTFLLKLGFGDSDRSFYFDPSGAKMSSKIEGGRWMDHSDLMKKYRDSKFTYNQMSLNQLNRNIKAYEAVKAAKELGLYISALTLPCIDEVGHREKMANLTAYLTAMKPLDISESVESQVKKVLNLDLKQASEEKAEEVDKIVQEQLNIAISSHSKHVVGLLSKSLFGNNPTLDSNFQKAANQYLTKLVRPMVHLLYMDHQIGRTQWLGRALIALQLRQGKEEAQKILKEELLASGIVIENLVGETWLMDNEDSNIQEAERSVLATLSKLRSEKKLTLEQTLDLKDRFDTTLRQWFQEKTNQQNQAAQGEELPNPLKTSLLQGVQKSFLALNIKKMSATEMFERLSGPLMGAYKKLNQGLITYKTKQIPTPVHTMSYLLTRNINIESAMTPSLALPGNLDIGKDFNLVGTPVSAINVIDADYVADNGYGLVARFKDRAFYRIMNNGFSHVGYAAVRRADGVSMTWVVDNYPTPVADASIVIPGARFNAGGVRWVGLEQFYKLSQHTRLSVITPDAKLFHEFAKPQIQKRLEAIGMGQEVLGTKLYDAIKPVLDASGKPTKVTENKIDDPWTMEINSATFKKIHQSENSDEWFESVSEAAMDKIQDFMYQGMSFVWITPYGQYFKGGGYCSFTGILGWNLGTGIDVLSTHKDQWSPLLKGLAAIRGQAEKKLSQLENSQTDRDEELEKKLRLVINNPILTNASIAASVDIYTPSGLPAQSYVPRKNVYQVVAPYRDINKRYSLLFNKDQKDFEDSKSVNPALVNGDEVLTPVSLDPFEVRGIHLDLIEVYDVKNSSSVK